MVKHSRPCGAPSQVCQESIGLHGYVLHEEIVHDDKGQHWPTGRREGRVAAVCGAHKDISDLHKFKSEVTEYCFASPKAVRSLAALVDISTKHISEVPDDLHLDFGKPTCLGFTLGNGEVNMYPSELLDELRGLSGKSLQSCSPDLQAARHDVKRMGQKLDSSLGAPEFLCSVQVAQCMCPFQCLTTIMSDEALTVSRVPQRKST
jgi:hypothetical protein